ncbi:MAG: ABC transporter ATP-binding protein [Rhodothermales bacterium]|nr:ABC transporter ATP-binding protein [Rhodothermales bacterium]
MPLLSARELRVSLDGSPILHGLDFDVEAGTWVGLLGPNGSGKTTLLRAVAGLLPYTGTLTVRGRSIAAWKPRALAQELAFVRQTTPLSFDFTVEELALLGRTPHQGWLGRHTAADRASVRQALARVDLSGFAHRSVLSLSGGERQRVFLAQALVQEAGLLLLDEPTAHLDVHYQFEFLEVVRELVAAGRTVIAVFHDLEQAARFADALIVLQQGRIAAAGAPGAVLTEALLATVFRMRARVEQLPGAPLRIRYDAPVE